MRASISTKRGSTSGQLTQFGPVTSGAFYRVDPADASHYHLVIDSIVLPSDGVVDMIVIGAALPARRATAERTAPADSLNMGAGH